MNWKVRFKTPVWLTSFIAFVVSTVYQALALFNVAPAIDQEIWLQVAAAVIQLLTLLGVLVDPTTAGISDSERAMGYDKPNPIRG